jgi:hypothetical protein
LFFISFFSVFNVSFCPKSPRMVIHFDYNGNKVQVIRDIRNLLINNGYVIEEYAPTEGFLFTDYKYHNWGTGERMLALIVDIDDKITITAKGKLAVPVAGIGGRERILRIKSVDKLPYRVQKKIFFPLINSMDSLGYGKIEQYP